MKADRLDISSSSISCTGAWSLLIVLHVLARGAPRATTATLRLVLKLKGRLCRRKT